MGGRYSEGYDEGEGDIAGGFSAPDVPNYELAFEIQCGATVGSAAVAAIPDGSGDVEIFVPSYEVNKVSNVRSSTFFSSLFHSFFSSFFSISLVAVALMSLLPLTAAMFLSSLRYTYSGSRTTTDGHVAPSAIVFLWPIGLPVYNITNTQDISYCVVHDTGYFDFCLFTFRMPVLLLVYLFYFMIQ